MKQTKCTSENHYSPERLLRKEGTFDHTCPECGQKNKYKLKFKGKNGENGSVLTHANKEEYFQIG